MPANADPTTEATHPGRTVGKGFDSRARMQSVVAWIDSGAKGGSVARARGQGTIMVIRNAGLGVRLSIECNWKFRGGSLAVDQAGGPV